MQIEQPTRDEVATWVAKNENHGDGGSPPAIGVIRSAMGSTTADGVELCGTVVFDPPIFFALNPKDEQAAHDEAWERVFAALRAGKTVG